MKICIVGGVAGGATTAARLRRLDEHAELIMFERGRHISFATCGLPYHLSGKIRERESLLLQTPKSFRARYAVDVRVAHEVLAIDRTQQELVVRELDTGREYRERYDRLVLSPGSTALMPAVDGDGPSAMHTLKDLADLDRILAAFAEREIDEAVVIGGGYLGLEVTENLQERGIMTDLVELAPQVLPPFDPEMAAIVQHELTIKGVELHLGAKLQQLRRLDGGRLALTLSDGSELETDLVVAAIGVRPETGLAADCGLALGTTGGIAVDEHQLTSDPHIYAVGDAVEVRHRVSGQPSLIPLAGPAYKQARVAANHIAGLSASAFRGTQGTSILKVFDLAAAATGLCEREAARAGLPCLSVHVHPGHHVGYFPGATPLHLKILFAPQSGQLLGAQCVGEHGVDKRIDVLATAIRAGMTVFDLTELELCYAPPYGAARDPVNVAGLVATNLLAGITTRQHVRDLDGVSDLTLLDVREPEEQAEHGHLAGAVEIPLDQLRDRLRELPRTGSLALFCAQGLRAYAAERILIQRGFGSCFVVSGGYATYQHATHADRG